MSGTMSDTSLLKVPQSDAVALLTALGYKTAKKMTVEKLTEQINGIEEAPAEPLATEELDKLMDDLMSAEVATVVPTEVEEVAEEAELEAEADASAKAEAEAEETPPVKKTKKKTAKAEPAAETSEKPKKKPKKAPAPPRLTRAAAATRFISAMTEPLKRDAVVEGADQLYADAGGTANIKEAAFGYRVTVEVMKELDLISVESGVVKVK